MGRFVFLFLTVSSQSHLSVESNLSSPKNARCVGLGLSCEMQPTPGFLPGRFYGQRSLVGYSHEVAKSQTQLSMTSLNLNTSLKILSPKKVVF